MTRLRRPLAVTALIVASIPGLLYVGQRELLYPAPAVALPGELPPGVEKIDFAEGYGLLLLPEPRPHAPAPLIIYTHGNAELAFQSIEHFDTLLGRGIAVLLVEYPGYGGAPGRASLDSIRRSVLAAYDAMIDRPDIDAHRIVAYGRSMGGGAASLLAAERKLAALCLEATFSSLARLVKEKGFPSMLLRDRYDNRSIVARLDIPVFLYHGTRDSLIPIQHSESLRQAGKDVTLVTDRCGHNDCRRPWPALLRFLEQKAGL